MYAPTLDDEITSLTRYIDQQLDAIRAAAYGLTEEQARATPCRSELSIGGLLKHTLHGMRGAVGRLRGDAAAHDTSEAGVAAYLAQFRLTDDETTLEVLAAWDAARADLLAALADADPGAEVLAPAEPWHGRFEPQPIHLRFFLLHQVEEFARHAGHADIIREQLDGVSVPALVLTVEGAPANPFFTPFEPAPGTIGT
ncbi:DUF664 domain-containing protein [Nocardioides sp. LHD-245]|uniref:mycothiol transferase n=1 Tax=Nocardioides sp. LHD-245 TaxID=3051387 RepID=UPI0027DFCFF6|nr:DUF664 domain-containing protein [Nocardioides sp. LHD-245]